MVQSTSLRALRGYSLVELLVVLAILGLMLAVGIPWFVKLTQRTALKSAARDIQISLSAARMTAVKRNAPVQVVIASLTPPIAFQIIEPDPPAPTPTLPPKYVMLNANAVRFQQTPNTTNGTLIFNGDGRLLTTPALGALTPSAQIIVEGPANSSPRNPITIDVNTRGAVKVITPVDWQ